MSATPEFEMSSEYTYVAAAMTEGLERIMNQGFHTLGTISPGILTEAKGLFSKAINVINGEERTIPEEATAYAMVVNHLRDANPKRYETVKPEESRMLYKKDIRSLASLIDNLGLLRVPEDQRGDVPILQRFFALLTETGENSRYQEVMSGKAPDRYVYS